MERASQQGTGTATTKSLWQHLSDQDTRAATRQRQGDGDLLAAQASAAVHGLWDHLQAEADQVTRGRSPATQGAVRSNDRLALGAPTLVRPSTHNDYRCANAQPKRV